MFVVKNIIVILYVAITNNILHVDIQRFTQFFLSIYLYIQRFFICIGNITKITSSTRDFKIVIKNIVKY